jgi:hypothetical protein
MDNVKVVIENWPKTNYLIQYMSIIISLIALVVSLLSVYLAWRFFIVSHRPYVWASSYGVPDPVKKAIIPVPHGVAYRVRNSPAKIIRTEVRVNLSGETLFTHVDAYLVRFPDERSEWSFSFSQKDFEKLMDRDDKDKAKLQRLIFIDYSSLDGGKIYHYELQQSFVPADFQWQDTSVTAD